MAIAHVSISFDNEYTDYLFYVAWVVIVVLVIWRFTVYFLKRRRLKQQGIRVQGTVVKIIEQIRPPDDDGNPDILYYPVIEYTTLEGKTISKKNEIGRYPTPYHLGDKVFIFYDPADASSYIIE